MPAEKFRRLKSRSGSIGSWAVASRTTNATSSSRPPISVPETAGSPNPSRGCSISANTVHAKPEAAQGGAEEVDPSPLHLSGGRRDGDRDQPQADEHERHVDEEHRPPIRDREQLAPTSGPRIPAIAPHAVQLPIAAPRSSSEKVFTITASELGTSSAPAQPCKARVATNTPMLGASAQATEVTPKPTTPIVTVFEKAGTFINQQFRLQKFAAAVPGPLGVADDLATLARLVQAAGGPALANDLDAIWATLAAEVKPLAAVSYQSLPATGRLLEAGELAKLPFPEGETLHFKPAQAAVAAT